MHNVLRGRDTGADERGEIGSRRETAYPNGTRLFLKSACLYNERTTRTASKRVCAACHGAKLIQVHSSSLTLRVSLSAFPARRSPASSSSCLTIRKQWRGSTFKDCRCWAAHDNYHRARGHERARLARTLILAASRHAGAGLSFFAGAR